MSEELIRELSWVRLQMPILAKTLEVLPSLRGVKLACCINLDRKIVPLIEGLTERQADIYLTTCNPTTVQPDVIDYLSEKVTVEAWRDMPADKQEASLKHALQWKPTHLCEMGAALTFAYHETSSTNVQASIEATRSGIERLGRLSLRYPVFNANAVSAKEEWQSHFSWGVMTWHAFLGITHLTLHGKKVLVLGFGASGRSIAEAARACGGCVSVVEVDRVRAHQAAYTGWSVLGIEAGIASADIIVTATGVTSVIDGKLFNNLKDGAILLNAGPCSQEIDVETLFSHPHRQILTNIEAIEWGSRTIYLIARGESVNLLKGWEASLNCYDITLSILANGIAYAVGAGSLLSAGIHPLPATIWEKSLP